MKIALDFDGVLSNTMLRWVEEYNKTKRFGADMCGIRDVSEWDFYQKFSITRDQCFDIFHKIWKDHTKLIPMEFDIGQKTRMLSNLCGGQMDIVTAVHANAFTEIRKFLEEHNVSFRDIVHSNTKHELDYDVYIDDSPKNVMQMKEAGKIALMYNQPWNRHLQPHKGKNEGEGEIRLVYNLYHAIDEVRMMKDAGWFN